MLPSFLLTLREGVEVSLIIGIILGTLVKLDRPHLRSSVWLGVGMATIVSIGAAVIIHSVGTSFTGRSEEIFEGVTMVIAAIVLTWVIFWMNLRLGISTRILKPMSVQQPPIEVDGLFLVWRFSRCLGKELKLGYSWRQPRSLWE